jgi:hypothetical protein
VADVTWLGTVPPVPPSPRVRIWAGAFAVVVLAACSGGGDGGRGSTTSTTETEAVRAELTLGQRVHSAGFVIDAVKVQVARNPVGRHTVELVATIENVGPAPVPFEPVARLEHGGAEFDREPDPGDEIPSIPPATPTTVVLRFALPDGVGEDGTGLAGGRILFGDPGQHRAVIPLDGAPPHALAPIPASASGRLVAGNVTVTLGGGHARFDDPLSHENLTAGRALVVLGFNASRGQGGAPNLARDNFRLQLPDGSVTAVRRDGRSAPNVLLAPRTVSENLSVRFEVPDPPAGDYVLIVVGPYADDGSEVRGELGFSVG